MASEKTNKKQWGGTRNGAGRPEGSTKAKICVSVHQKNWNTALKRWKQKPSWLVDFLVLDYIKRGGAALKMKAAL
jgi:hypothetical protein